MLTSRKVVVDCAEGTQLQTRRSYNPKVHLKAIRKIFITHMHVDHVMGIVPLMNSAMSANHKGDEHLRDSLRLELYGPAGLRRFIRENLFATRMNLLGRYTVHELLTRSDQRSFLHGSHHPNEMPGNDIRCRDDGLWRNIIVNDDAERVAVRVDAGPVKHRIPCLGYVFTEEEKLEFLPPPLRSTSRKKVVVLGDTSDASALEKIAMDASILVHEATNAWMPPDLGLPPSKPKLDSQTSSSDPDSAPDPSPAAPPHLPPKTPSKASETSKASLVAEVVENTPASVRERAAQNGHSTPEMAGSFARRVRARQLFMTHLSAKFPDPGPVPRPRPPRQQSQPSLLSQLHSQLRLPPESQSQSSSRSQSQSQSQARTIGHHPSPDPPLDLRMIRHAYRSSVIAEIERQASEAWGSPYGCDAVVARDLLTVPIKSVTPEEDE